jgi:hypothetical protein
VGFRLIGSLWLLKGGGEDATWRTGYCRAEKGVDKSGFKDQSGVYMLHTNIEPNNLCLLSILTHGICGRNSRPTVRGSLSLVAGPLKFKLDSTPKVSN